LYTAKEVNEKIDNVNKNTLLTIIRAKPFDEKAYNDTKAKITAMNLANTNRVFFESDLRLAQKNSDWNTYAKLAVGNVDTYYGNDPNKLNSIAWDFYEKVSDKSSLLKAESWAAKAVELDPSYPNMDTYASVLYKTGKSDQALQMANKAIEVAKKDGYAKEDYKGTKDLIEKIKAPK
jgi:tetratricopeptide (TPR) repeat protein